MKTIYLTAILFLLLTFPKAFANPISLAHLTKDSLMTLVVDNPDSVLAILDKVEDIGGTKELPPYRISLIRGIAYNEKRMLEQVDKYAREALASEDIKSNPKDETNALTLLACAQSFFGNIEGCIETLSRALEIARNNDNLSSELNVLTTMAKNYFTLGNQKEGYAVIEQILKKGSSSRDVRVLANVSAAYGVKVNELYNDKRFDEAIEESQKRLKLIERIDEVGGAPEGFTDQQRGYAYARIASSAEKIGKKDVATKAFEDFSATKFGNSVDGRLHIVDYLLESGKYSSVLEYTRPLYTLFEGADTINMDCHDLLLTNAKAYYGLGNCKKGYELLYRASVIHDSIDIRVKNTQAQKLATIFSLNEKTLELEKEKAESQKRLIFLWSITGICLLVVIILLILLRQYKIAKRHQDHAILRIGQLMKERETQNPSTEENDDPDRKLFLDMENKIISEDLFTNTTFNRDDIAAVTGLSRTKVVQLIRKYTDLTPNDYINKLRVEHSVKLIKEHLEWSIDGIAESCGYVRRATYYDHFNKFYGITPAQYRKGLLDSSAAEETAE